MAILDILQFPDPRLRTEARPVDRVDDDVRRLVDDMFETMYAAPGIGLAATQVDVHRQVIVIDGGEVSSTALTDVPPGTPVTSSSAASAPMPRLNLRIIIAPSRRAPRR